MADVSERCILPIEISRHARTQMEERGAAEHQVIATVRTQEADRLIVVTVYVFYF